MIPRPDFLPAWATQDQKNDESGQYNVVKPPGERELSGWLLGEKPNRQWWNWLHRQTYLWLAYFDQNLDFEANTLVPNWTGLDGTLDLNNFYYSRDGDQVNFTCKIQWSGNASAAPLVMTNLPFAGKGPGGFGQSVPCVRSSSAIVTVPSGKQLACLISSGSTELRIIEIDNSTGLQNALTAKGAQGELIITGFYFTDL